MESGAGYMLQNDADLLLQLQYGFIVSKLHIKPFDHLNDCAILCLHHFLFKEFKDRTYFIQQLKTQSGPEFVTLFKNHFV